MKCRRCGKSITGDMPVLDRGFYFHQNCWVLWLHVKNLVNIETWR